MNTSARFALRTLIISIVAAVTLGTAACSGDATAAGGPDEIAIVVGNRANAPLATADQVGAALDSLDAVGDRVIVIAADGKPDTVYDYTITDLPPNSIDAAKALEALHTTIDSAIAAAVANDAEVDQVEAISVAARQFDPAAASRTIVMLDSGLQTTGLFSMLGGGLYADPSDRVQALQDANSLPLLDGIEIQLRTLGVTDPPQEPVTEDAWQALVGQWTTLITAAGATMTVGGASSATAPQTVTDLPTVTPVPIARPAGLASGCTWSLRDGTVGFVADSAEFLDRAAAEVTIAAAATGLDGCEGPYSVVGSTSSAGDDSVNGPLSTARAQAVGELFAAEVGVALDAIRITGFGAQWSCRVADRGPDGELLADAAAANRVVMIARGDEGQCPR